MQRKDLTACRYLVPSLVICGLWLAGCLNHPESGQSKQSLVGGVPAWPGQYDATIFLRPGCTATVVGERYILTAAHCVARVVGLHATAIPDPAFMPGATLSFTNEKITSELVIHESSYQQATIQWVHFPPEWQRVCGVSCNLAEIGAWGDIAVIETRDRIRGIPAARIHTSMPAVNAPVVITGYGCEHPEISPPVIRQLKYHFTQVVPNPIDSALIGTPGIGADPAAAGNCPEDSGGPLYYGTESAIVGVNSFSTVGSRAQLATMNFHTSTAAHATWLRSILPASSFVGTTASNRASSEASEPDATVCNDRCAWADDGECDDGGTGSDYSICKFGSDCSDCGPRR